MVIFSYTHTFTLQQLQVILTQYLQLGPYFQCLKKVLQNYISRFSSLPITQRHNPEKQHPIKLPLNFYKYRNKQSGQIDKDCYQGEVDYVYPLTTVVEVLNSNEFYQNLPKNIIINGLLTTTNISIIVQTLTILSEQLSKLIKSTLESIEEKHLVSCINTLVNDCLEENNPNEPHNSTSPQNRLSLKDLGFLGMLFSKGLNMVADQKKTPSSSSEVQSVNTNSQVLITGLSSDSNIPEPKFASKSTQLSKNKSKQSSILQTLLNSSQINNGKTKNVLQKFRSLIADEKALCSLRKIEDSMVADDKRKSYGEDCSKPKEFEQCEYCRDMRDYLLESSGFSYFDMSSISKIPTDLFNMLKRIKSVTNVFTLYLRETNRTTIPADINTINKVLSNVNIVITESLWEDTRLNPQMAKKYAVGRKMMGLNPGKQSKNPTLLNELEPYFNEVYSYKNHGNDEYTIDELLRICLKALQHKEIQKILAQKYMNEARVKKEGKDIETFCITRQKLNDKMNILLKAETDPFPFSKANSFQASPHVNQIELLKEYQKQQAIINRALISSKPLYSQINQNYQHQANIGAQIKRLKNINSTKSSKNIEKSQALNKLNNDAIQNEKFKMLIYQQYMRNQGFNVTKNNFSSIMNQNILKVSKSMNFIGNEGEQPDFGIKDHIESNYSQFHPGKTVQTPTTNTLSTVHLKTEQNNDISYEKKETQIYNKMLLNGETVRTEVLNDVQYGEAVIYGSFDDFLDKLDDLATQDQANLAKEEVEDDIDQNLFLTVCGPNLKKNPSNKKSASKNPSSIRNFNRFDMEAPNKTQTRKLHKKMSIMSVQNSKDIRSASKSNFFKKTFFEESAKNQKESRLKNEITFEAQTGAQSSVNDSYSKIQSSNAELKKPAWLDQYADKVCAGVEKRNSVAKTPKHMLQNERFLAFQEKKIIEEYLNAEQKMKLMGQSAQKIILASSQIQATMENMKNSSSSQIKRPISGVSVGSKSKMGTIKSMSRMGKGKKRSFMVGKEFGIGNNSLLSTIYKQNMANNVFKCAKRQVDEERAFEEFSMNITRSKFTVEKLID